MHSSVVRYVSFVQGTHLRGPHERWLRDCVALNFHPTKFGSNCRRLCGYMDKTGKRLLTGGQKLSSSLRMDLGGELVNVITGKRYLLLECTHLIHETL